jgi:hypothetical protein
VCRRLSVSYLLLSTYLLVSRSLHIPVSLSLGISLTFLRVAALYLPRTSSLSTFSVFCCG